jgi:hypothetical protein
MAFGAMPDEPVPDREAAVGFRAYSSGVGGRTGLRSSRNGPTFSLIS